MGLKSLLYLSIGWADLAFTVSPQDNSVYSKIITLFKISFDKYQGNINFIFLSIPLTNCYPLFLILVRCNLHLLCYLVVKLLYIVG
jgi:hypothetical protein